MQFANVLKSLFYAAILLFSSAVQAAPWYRVEVILFEHLYSDGNGETWDKLPGLPEKDRLITVGETGDDGGYLSIVEGKRRLAGIYSALRFSKQYRPILHMAWQQPGLGASRARNVQIRKIDSVIVDNGVEVPILKADGVVKIRSTRLLHVDVDLAYFFQPVSETELLADIAADDPANPLRYARLKESRKIKLNEVHYFDHPLFGALIQVSRLATE